MPVTLQISDDGREVIGQFYVRFAENEFMSGVQKQVEEAIKENIEKIIDKDVKPLIRKELKDIEITIKKRIIEILEK